MDFGNLSHFDIYPDRFIKYKLKESKSVNCAIVAETWEKPAQQRMYNYTSDFDLRTCNIPHNYTKVSYLEITEVFTNPDLFHDYHYVVLPTELSIFEGSTYWSPGPIYETTETIILTAVPKHTTLTTLSFLKMDALVVAFTILALISVALTLTIIQVVRNSHRESNHSNGSKDVAFNCLQHLWNSASIFCTEPYPIIPRIVSTRIATQGWLLGVTLFVSVVNCVMKSDFSEIQYQYIDDLKTLMENRDVKPVIIKDGFTHLFLQIAAKRDEKIKAWIDNFDEDNYCSVLDLMDLGFYEDILKGNKALIINRLLLTWFLGYELSQDLEETHQLKTKYGGFYISKERVKSDFLAFLVNSTFKLNSPIVYEEACLGNMVIFETVAYEYLDMNSKFAMQFMEWTKPSKDIESLNLSAMTGPFLILFNALGLALAVFFLETAFFVLLRILKKKPSHRRRDNRISIFEY